MTKNNLFTIFCISLRLSASTFGGGYILIAAMRRIYTERLRWLTEEEMLDITAEQFAAVGDAFDAILAQGYRCSVGNEKNIADNGELFDNLVTVN